MADRTFTRSRRSKIRRCDTFEVGRLVCGVLGIPGPGPTGPAAGAGVPARGFGTWLITEAGLCRLCAIASFAGRVCARFMLEEERIALSMACMINAHESLARMA